MGPDSILAKTDKGADEIATRKYKLDPKLRTLLIMVNGTASVGQLAQKFAGLDIQPLLAQLEKDGYVREGAAAAPGRGDARQVCMQLSRAITDLLGPSGDAITEKLEACNSLDEVRAFLHARKGMLTQAMGRKAPDFWAKADTLTR